MFLGVIEDLQVAHKEKREKQEETAEEKKKKGLVPS